MKETSKNNWYVIYMCVCVLVCRVEKTVKVARQLRAINTHATTKAI